MTTRNAGLRTRPKTRWRADDEYSLTPKTVYRLVGGVAALGLLLLIFSAFTSGRSRATLTGRISHRGKPVIWGSVILVGPDGLATTGRIEPDGTYSVPNAPPVTVHVAVLSPDPLVQHYAQEIRTHRERLSIRQWEAPPVDRSKWFPLPPQYEDPQTSGLVVTLKKGSNAFNIELP